MIEPMVARRIRLVGLDVDGTLTDGGVYLGAAPQGPVELKRYDIQDGVGIHLLRRAGVVVVMVTGRGPEVAKLRADDLAVDEFAADAGAHKLPLFQAMLERRKVQWDEACFVGDDLPDLPIMRRVALPVAVANAVQPVKDIARHTTARTGGHGAIREFVEALLGARGAWQDVVRGYLEERGDVRR